MVKLLMVRIRRRRDRDSYHFGVRGVVGAGSSVFHLLILRLWIWIWDGVILRLVFWKISGVGTVDPIEHLLSHINIIRTWNLLDDSGGEEGNLMFRSRIDVVTPIKIFEDQGYPAWKGHVVGSFEAGD